MNDWICPKCGVLNSDNTTFACCANCGNSKWATMPTVTLPAINYHRIIGENVAAVPAVTYASFNCPRGVFKCGDNVLCGDCKGFTEVCPDCDRLKELLADVWEAWRMYNSPVIFEKTPKLIELQARIKQEGI